MIKGLLLTGGLSQRMGQPKQLLTHEGETFKDRSLRLLSEVCDEVYVSLPYGAEKSNAYDLPDLAPSQGPLGGMATAFAHSPDCDWLVLACDLPNVGKEDLLRLVESREQNKDIVCYLNPYDAVPEGHCSLYSPSAKVALDKVFESNSRCLRSFLENLSRVELAPDRMNLLTNLNYPEDLNEWKAQQGNEVSEKQVTVEYYAKLREEAGCSSEHVTSTAVTLAGLWEECRMRHHLSTKLPEMKPAVNNAFTSWNHAFSPDDIIAFMPPFMGG